MRLSSRRLKVTWFTGAVNCAPGYRPRGTGWDRFRRNRTSCGASFVLGRMIAPGAAHGKGFLRAPGGLKTCRKPVWAITNSLKAPTITPNFGQSPVTLHWDNGTVASRPGPVRAPDSSAPQPPGARSAGPVEFRVRFNPLMPSGRLNAGPIFSELTFQTMVQFVAAAAASSSRSAQHQAGLGGNAALHDDIEPVDIFQREVALGISFSGTLKLSALPFQSPSFTQRRTTLCRSACGRGSRRARCRPQPCW